MARKNEVRNRAESRFKARRKKVLSRIKGEAAIFCSAAETTRSRDLQYSFHQNSDFFYLTGFEEPDAVLLLLGGTKGPRSVLFLRERSPEFERWIGPRLGTKRAQKKFEIDEVLPIDTLSKRLPKLLAPVLQTTGVVHFTPGLRKEIDELIWSGFSSPVNPRPGNPNTIKDARLLTSEMRLKKDRDEIRAIRHACDITAESFWKLARSLNTVKSERHAARILESSFSEFGGHGIAFETIVASGKHATTLHHHPTFQPLWKRELVLIDAGASYNGYCADITRTFPASGTFSSNQALVYDVVHNALVRATRKVAPGRTLDQIHQAAVSAITSGLVALGVLEGTVRELIALEAYKPFFMHRTSHWLGIDVHDISPISLNGKVIPSHKIPLEPGYVFTIEPGLYFDPKDKSVPVEFRGIGIRLENDILVTNSGYEILTEQIPTERSEVEKIFT